MPTFKVDWNWFVFGQSYVFPTKDQNPFRTSHCSNENISHVLSAGNKQSTKNTCSDLCYLNNHLIFFFSLIFGFFVFVNCDYIAHYICEL